MERLTMDEAIAHANEVAQEKYNEGFLCHANPNDEKLDVCIKCAKEHEQLAEWLSELKGYKQLEEQGLLLKLPCKVGNTIYTIYSDEDGSFIEKPIVEDVSTHRIWVHSMFFDYSDIGKTVFLTQAEAEEALAEMESTE